MLVRASSAGPAETTAAAAQPFEVERDPKCPKGRHLRIQVPHLEPEVLFAAMAERWGGSMVRRSERIGATEVVRVLVPFAFELRLGPEPDLLRFVHRSGDSPDDWAPHLRDFERVLTIALATSARRRTTP